MKPQQVIHKSSKVSKDLDCTLVSNQNFSKIIPSIGLGPGPGKVGQGGLKVFQLWRHSQKILTPQTKIFFRVQTARLVEFFEILTGSVALMDRKNSRAKPRSSGFHTNRLNKLGYESVNLILNVY